MKMLPLIFFSLILFFPIQARRVFPGEMLWNMAQLTTEASYDVAISQDNMPLTITTEGTYTFAQSLTGTITISANNVVVNLNGHGLTGNISSNGFSNIIIFNGLINQVAATSCIDLDNAVNIQIADIDFSNGTIGIDINATSSNILIENCNFSAHTANGINMDTVNGVFVGNCGFSRHTSAAQGVIQINNVQDVTLANLDISNNSNAIGINAINLRSSEIVNCYIRDNNRTGTYFGISLSNAFENILNNCILQNNTATGSFMGIFFATNNESIINNCIISNNTSTLISRGIQFSLADNCIIENSKVTNNICTSDFFGIDILTTSSSNIIEENIVANNQGGVNSVGIRQNVVAGNINTFLSNISQNNFASSTVSNYSGVPVGTINIVTYIASTGTYSTTPASQSNLDVR